MEEEQIKTLVKDRAKFSQALAEAEAALSVLNRYLEEVPSTAVVKDVLLPLLKRAQEKIDKIMETVK